MKFLSQLKIQRNNNGVSTGLLWPKAKGEKINSYSPVDGTLIAAVTAADKNNYKSSRGFCSMALMACTKTW